MKLLLISALAVVGLLLLTIVGVAGGQPFVTSIGFCSLGLFAMPLLWVALYRQFGHLRLMNPRR